MASAMRADLDDEMEDQFEMSLEDVSDPVVPIEPPPTMSHAAASEEREEAWVCECGWKKDLHQVVTGTGAVGQGHPAANPEE